MTTPLEGIRVVEVGLYAMAPSCAAVLGEWGADVVKVEHPVHGDPIRGLTAFGIEPGTKGITHMHETFNRGKRSVGLDLATDQGRELLCDLVRRADVFVTNFLPRARRKLRIDVEDLVRVNPRLVYARASAHGPLGPEAEIGGYDNMTYWHRSGLASSLTADGDDIALMPVPAVGDIQSGMNLAGGIAAALLQRDRTGRSVIVDGSLLAAGMWAMSAAFTAANNIDQPEVPKFSRREAWNPLVNAYRTSDGRFVILNMLFSDRFWPRLCEVLERPELAEDERFSTADDRQLHRLECVRALDEAFFAHDAEHWKQALGSQGGQWAVAQRVGELNDEQQAWDNGYLRTIQSVSGQEITLVSAPVQFDERPGRIGPAPELGAHTEEVLLELGLSWDRIVELKELAVIT